MGERMGERFALVSDIGSTFFRVGIISSSGKILGKEKNHIDLKEFSEKILVNKIIDFFERCSKGKTFLVKELAGIGVSIAGAYDSREQVVKSCFGIRLNKKIIKESLGSYFNAPVNILNDGNAGVLGEKHFGAGRDKKNIVYVTISTGIGGGAIVNGSLLLGKDGNAAEIGHMIIDMDYQHPCTCGKGSNHWESYASGRNIPNFFAAWMKRKGVEGPGFEHNTSEEIFRAANEGKDVAAEFVRELGVVNGKGLSNVIVAYDPETIVLGGAVVLNNKEWILSNLTQNIHVLFNIPEITITRLGDDAPLFGAAASIFGEISGIEV